MGSLRWRWINRRPSIWIDWAAEVHLLLIWLTLGCAEVEPTESTAVEDPLFPLALVPNTDIDDAMSLRIDDGVVGLGVGIAVNGTVVFLGGYGFEDRAQGIAVDPSETMFRWASLSKGLTGVIAAQGAASGAIDLDDAVSDWVSEFPVPTTVLPSGCGSLDCAEPLPADHPPVTLRTLLSHVGGAQHYTNGVGNPTPSPVRLNDPAVNTGMAWALPLWTANPLVAVPETSHKYSSFGYNLAGVAIERASGATLAELVAADVSVPLGLTTLQPDYHWVDIPRRTVGYVASGDGMAVQVIDTDVSWKLAGGGFTSTVEDLTRYCAGLNDGVLLDRETRDGELWRSQYPALSNYGFGFSVRDTDAGPRVSHTGAQEKTRTALVAWPEEGLCITIMTNSENVSPMGLLNEVEAAWRLTHP